MANDLTLPKSGLRIRLPKVTWPRLAAVGLLAGGTGIASASRTPGWLAYAESAVGLRDPNVPNQINFNIPENCYEYSCRLYGHEPHEEDWSSFGFLSHNAENVSLAFQLIGGVFLLAAVGEAARQVVVRRARSRQLEYQMVDGGTLIKQDDGSYTPPTRGGLSADRRDFKLPTTQALRLDL